MDRWLRATVNSWNGLNTAIEKLADHVAPTLHPGIGRIKDMGSAAVGVALLLAAAIWLVAIGERLAIL
jgi:diacylglycerol kinase (ATP)